MAEKEKPKIARIRIDLRHVEPCVRRCVDVPISASLDSLHWIIQTAMGWDNDHMHEFEIGGRRYEHHEPFFDVGDHDSEVISSRAIDLAGIIAQGVKKFVYLYDFGDNWTHEINIGRVRDGKSGEKFPLLIDASGRCPPEDCGGAWGYADLLEVLGDPAHKDHEEMLEWCGEFDPQEIDEQGIQANLWRVPIVPKSDSLG
ncbi:MAG: plasmid pRiA4b ORF-3 family protein [Gammaproteobacteria bacterium]|nr:plasmid pRiA4b ORF-3 family protein [Gammaproteobacteria bacterium]